MALTKTAKILKKTQKEQNGQRRKVSPRTVKRLVQAFSPYKFQIIVLVINVILISILNLVTPVLIPGVFDDAIAHHNVNRLFLYAFVMVVATLLAGMASLLHTYLNSFVGQRVMRDLRNRLYSHLQDLPLTFFTSHRAGEVQSRLSNDINGIQSAITDSFALALSNAVTTISTIIAMIYISPLLTLVSFLLLPIFLWVTYKVGRARHQASKATQESLASLSALMQETLSVSGILLIKTFGRKSFATRQFAHENQELTDLGVRQQMVGRRFFALVNTFFGIIPIITSVVAGLFIIYRMPEATVGEIFAFILLQNRFFSPFTQLLTLHINIQGALALFERVFEYLDLPVGISDATNAITLSPDDIRGEVAFSNVSFTYPYDSSAVDSPTGPVKGDLALAEQHAKTLASSTSETSLDRTALRQTLCNISFCIKPGQLVALVGPSGSGKTTLTYLLSRLYDVEDGAIEIDGYNVKDITLASLGSVIGVVTQETYLFHTSIRENLLYVKPDATEEEIVAAAKAAAIHDLIIKLAKGYDTVVGERGYKLSGGEKQRLAIARVLLKNPRILILDEATSSLDTHSERLIQAALEPLMKNRTTLAIAHRLSTIQAADNILVLEDGTIVEQGTHQDLLRSMGLYSRLYGQQFATEIIE